MDNPRKPTRDQTGAEPQRLWILIAGPYTAGGADVEKRAANLRALNAAALAVFEKGHVPIIGVNLALPIIAEAGEAHFDRIMMPLSLEAARRCDAVLRIGGKSRGADEEVELVRKLGGRIYGSLNEIPSPHCGS